MTGVAKRRASLAPRCDLNQVPHVSSNTAVVTGPMSTGSRVKRIPKRGQPLELRGDIVDGEERVLDPVCRERCLEGTSRGMAIGLEHELDAIRIGRHDGQPAMAAHRNFGLFWNPSTSM